MKKKRAKKINWFLKILKTTGISLAGILGFTGASVGVYALFGGFKDKVVSLQGMNFEQAAYVLTGTNVDGKIMVGVKSSDSGEIESVKLIPTNEDATKLDVSLSGGQNIVRFLDNQKVGSPIQFEIVQSASKDPNNSNRVTYHNKGGDFTLEAVQKEDQQTTKTQIFIDTKVQSFNLVAKNNDEEIDQSKIYKGTQFKMCVENIFPSNSLDVPKNNLDTYKSIYGQDFFNKTILFFSQNEDIAEVNRTTGEVKVKSDGSFTIDCYIASSYENNAKLPQYSSSQEYIDELSKYTVKKSIQFVSKPIEVSGISASSEVSKDLYVFNTYKYVVDSTAADDEESINLDFSLSVPENSDYSADLLKHKREDIQLFEGFKLGDNYYLSSGQEFGETENVLLANYFTITKNINPLSWRIRVEDFSSVKDIYLVARISNKKLTQEDLAAINSEDGLLVQNTKDSEGNFAYYAFVKVKLQSQPTEEFSFKENKLLVSYAYDENNAKFDDNIVLLNQEMLNITTLIRKSDDNATYNFIRYFVVNNEVDGLQILDVKNDALQAEDQNEIRRYKKVVDSQTGETTFVEDMIYGTYIKALNKGSVQITAKNYKYRYKINSDGKYALDENNQRIYEFVEVNREANGELTLTVSQNINLKDFEINIDPNTDGLYEINKGENAIISFKTDNIDGLTSAFNEGYLRITSSNDNVVKISGQSFESNDANTITVSGASAGESIISILLNGKVCGQFKIKVVTNPITSINISNNDDAIINDKISFVVGTEPTDKRNGLVYFLQTSIGSKNTNNCVVLKISTVGGTNKTTLALEKDSKIVEINDATYISTNNIIEIDTSKLNDETERQITIYPHKLCSELKFSIKAIGENGEIVKSREISISIKTPENFEIIENRNTSNQISINGEIYEKVIGGEKFNLKCSSSANNNLDGFVFFNGLSSALFGQECLSLDDDGNKLYDSSFKEVLQETTCQIKITSEFFNESDCKVLNFMIVPKYFVSTTQIEVPVGTTQIDVATLSENAKLYKNAYSTTKTTYLGTIEREEVLAVTSQNYSFFNANGDAISGAYNVPTNNFVGSDVTVVCKIEYNGNYYEGKIKLSIPSNLTLSNSTKLINNGETVELNSLFGVYQKTTDTVIDASKIYYTLSAGTYTIVDSPSLAQIQSYYEYEQATKVLLEKQTIEKLLANNIKVYDKNHSSIEQVNDKCEVSCLEIPQDINVFEFAIKNLKADVVVTISGEEVTKYGHEFSLNLKITDLQLKANVSTVYLKEDELSLNQKTLKDDTIKISIVKMYVAVATENSLNFDLQDILNSENDIKNKISVSLEINLSKSGTISFKLNDVVLTTNLVVVSSLASKNADLSEVTSRAYTISDLITLDASLSDFDISDVYISKMFDNLGAELDASLYSLQSNNQVLTIKQPKANGNVECKIRFNILGRDVDIEYSFESFDVSLENYNTLYSNLSYQIFDDATLKVIDDNNLIFTVSLIDEDGNQIDNVISWSVSNKNQITISNYLGVDINNAQLKVVLHTENFEGSEIYRTVSIQKLVVSLDSTKSTTLIDNFEIDLKNYLIVEASSAFNEDNEHSLAIYVDGVLKHSDLDASKINEYVLSFIPIFGQDKEKLTLKVTLLEAGKEKEVKTIDFSVKRYNLEKSMQSQSFLVGQDLTRDDLLSLVQITDMSGNVITRLNSQIEFYLAEDTTYQNKICENNSTLKLDVTKSIVAKFGKQVLPSITLTPSNVDIIIASDEVDAIKINAYPDTKLSNYAKAEIDGETKSLELIYAPEDTTIWQDKGEFYVYSNETIKINKTTGEIYILKNATISDFNFKVSVKNSTVAKIFTVSIKELEIVGNGKSLSLYAGDYEIDLSNESYFKAKDGTKELKEINFEIASIQDLSNVGYIAQENTKTNEFDVVVGGVSHLSLVKNSNNYRTKLQLTSNVQQLNLIVRGYLNINAIAGETNYTIESLKENYIEITIEIDTISVNFGSNIIDFNNTTYYILEGSVNDDGSATYVPNANINPQNSISSLKFIAGENFIGRVSNTGVQPTASEVLKYLNEEKNSLNVVSKVITPTKNEIQISGINFITSKPLTEYVFLIVEYTIGNYTNTVGFVLKPQYHIGFNYESTDAASGTDASIYSPAIYSLSSNGDLFYFDFGYSVANNKIYGKDISFEFAIGNTTTAGEFKTAVDSNHKLSYVTDLDGDSIKIESEVSSSGAGYTIRIKLKKSDDLLDDDSDNKIYYYYYYVEVTDITVQVYSDIAKENKNSGKNPLICNENEINLLNYIKINNEENSSFIEEISFAQISNENYTISQNGMLNILSGLSSSEVTEVKFYLLGSEYTIFLKGTDTTVRFTDDETSQQEISSKEFLSGTKTYFNLKTINSLNYVVLEDSQNLSTETFNGQISVENLCYNFSGSAYSDQELFDIVSQNGITTYSFGGQELFSLENKTSYYVLDVKSLNGTLTFDLVCKYSGKTKTLNCSLVYAKINVEYINPSVYQNQNYQNVLSGQNIDLLNFVSVTNSSASENLTFSFQDAFYSDLTIDGTILKVGVSLSNDIYAKVLVKLGSSTNYIYVRAIPLTKYTILNNARSFNVLKNEEINLCDYIKVYNFSGFDSINEPEYALNSTFSEVTNNVETEISEPFSYVIDANKIVKINNIEFTFVAKELIDESYEVCVGEALNLQNKFITKINALSLAKNTYNPSFYNKNGYVDASGNFVGQVAGEEIVVVSVAGASYNITINVLDLEIQVSNVNSIVKTDEMTNERTKYENIYTTQNVAVTDYVSVNKAGIDVTNDYKSSLVFDVTIFSYGKYNQDKIGLSSSTNWGTDTITIVQTDTNEVLFEIGQNGLACYSGLNSELEIEVEITLRNNSQVKNSLFLRLLPVLLIAEDTKTITNADLDESGYYNLLNVAEAKTNAEQYNLNLNDKIKFYDDKNQLIENGKLKIDGLSTTYIIKASLIEYSLENELEFSSDAKTITITYSNSGTNFEDKNLANVAVINSNTQVLANLAQIRAIRGENITYSLNSSTGVYVYEIYDQNSNLIFKVNSSGLVSDFNEDLYLNNLPIIIEAKVGSLIKSCEFLVSNANGIILNDHERYSIDNGTMVLNLMSNETLDVTNLLNGATIGADAQMIAVRIENDGNSIKITADNVETTTYGYFDITKSSKTARVYVKIHPTSLSTAFVEDFTFSGASVKDGLETLISKEEKFKQIYILSGATEKQIDLSECVKVDEYLQSTQNISFEIESVIEYNGTSYVKNSSLANIAKGTSTLVLTQHANSYYVKVQAKLLSNGQEIDSVQLRFKVLSVNDESATNVTIENNSTINLQSLIKLNANNNDYKVYRGNEIENIFKKADIKLVGAMDSYISSGKVVVNEKYVDSFKIAYSFDGTIKEIIIAINNSSDDRFTKNGISYNEISNSATGINLLNSENNSSTNDEISSLSVNYGDKTYAGVIETTTSSDLKTTIIRFKVDGYLRVTMSSTTNGKEDRTQNGNVEFWNASSGEWSKVNNIGVLYVTITRVATTKATTLSGESTISYTITSNFKLNDYIIEIDTLSNKIVFKNNFEILTDGDGATSLLSTVVENVLSFTIVSSTGEEISGSTISNGSITCNGITLNTKTGEYYGTKSENVKMFIKAYVPSNKLSFGENFKLFEIL